MIKEVNFVYLFYLYKTFIFPFAGYGPAYKECSPEDPVDDHSDPYADCSHSQTITDNIAE